MTKRIQCLNQRRRLRRGGEGFSRLHKILDHGEAIEFELIGSNWTIFHPFHGPQKRTANLTYQLRFRDAWVVIALAVETSSEGKHIIGANFQPIPDSLQVLNRFTLKHKSMFHYAFLAAAILIPLFSIGTLVVCIRSRVRLRWLWALFILLSFIQFQLNWSTGQWAVQPLSFLLLGAAFFRASSYASIILSVGVPIGAIIFWILLHRLQSKREATDAVILPTA